MNSSAKKIRAISIAITTSVFIPGGSAIAANLAYGETAFKEVEYLATNLAGRSVGTQKEQESIDYLTQRLEDFGYEPNLQDFTYEFSGQTLESPNIIATREGTSDKQIIVGAHYDNAPSSSTLDRSNLQGVNDNSSGVAVLLELAQRLEANPENTVKFVLFGAEEIGLVGSEYYANNMSQTEIDNTLVMVNLDSLIIGDKMYFNAGASAATAPELGVYRDLALDIAADLGIDAETNPGLNPNYPEGTGCCSDLESFDGLVPVLAAEATNWEIGEKDGYTQTSNPNVPGGATWHDPATDNLTFINEVFPGLIEERTQNYTQVFDTLLSTLNDSNTSTSVPEPTTALGTFIAVMIGGLLRKRDVDE
ncbi:Alkaline phosphatase isozyme conversion aminopeptidase [Hyella patelloides LEGE 07179]|uniref:Alkaline phosphatase isozyme conversion aminopeptidase n=1 Tax=Hyella patelloides LEGE 07179 TaxID=945734 RepID=A0A563VQ69_9CYAN|nr:M28 family peptidase [Hyella patelloides]VEP13529.1 Alkaline phosphatase isozyme conversion aminopeptidase [Hyella patelloides LEGE 07179]